MREAEELDRADEAAEAEVDEETSSPAKQRQPLRAHVNLGHPTLENSVVPCEMVAGCRQMGETLFRNVQSAKHDRCRELGLQQLCRNVTDSIKYVGSESVG